MTLLVDITVWDPVPWVTRFRELLPGRSVLTPRDTFDPAAVRYAAVWKHKAGGLQGLPNLAAIFSLGAGVDHVFADPDLPAVPIARVVDADLRDRMSEWVVLHVLVHHRAQHMYDWQQQQKIWEDDPNQPLARDVRVGLMGLGVMGADAARKLKAIGFDVAGWSRAARSVPGIECFAGRAELPAFLTRTDILVCLLPLTPETRGIIDAALIRQLARDGRLGGPILLNAGRGGLQVERDILACLDEGTLKAATLDVFEAEPLPQASPLWHHPRVTVTPHNAGISEPRSVAAYVVRQIEAFEQGGQIENIVDPRRQY
ncbi:MAG: glyoxylate/hydroxypyruvate reductase A [Methylobacteriaceae bacterium]|nr:glyoxylate/hydroxypyruvate reductase A [Methylobacteriaceae bacterium]